MRKIIRLFIWALLLAVLSACQIAGRIFPTPSLQPASPVAVSPTVSPTRSPATPTTAASPIAFVTATLTPAPPNPDQPAQALLVRYHPDGPLFAGDQISLEIIPPPGLDLKGSSVTVSLPTSAGADQISSASFSPFGIGGRNQATLWWAWDTSGLAPGQYELGFQVDSEGPAWVENVDLLAPSLDATAEWKTQETDCCLIHYITGTRAEREIEDLVSMVETQANEASQKLGGAPPEKIDLVIMPRVLGHGGFASQALAVSYLDRNYSGDAAPVVLHHELVHWLDSQLGGDLRPSMLVEGLAVYLTGGHYKQEPLDQRAAALLALEEGCSWPEAPAVDGVPAQEVFTCGPGRYIPINQLADHFYQAQHEIGYLEAGALISYMVKTWGWQAFTDFYRDIHPEQPGDNPGQASHSQAIDIALRKHYGIGLQELNDRFLAALLTEPVSSEASADLLVSILFYDTVRRYQQNLDPSAYFLTAWLPDTQEMRTRGIVADLQRQPGALENVALELMLVSADRALRAGDYTQAEALLAEVNLVLEQVEAGAERPFKGAFLAADYYGISLAAQDAGYQPSEIRFRDGQAWLSAISPDHTPVELFLRRGLKGWQIFPAAA